MIIPIKSENGKLLEWVIVELQGDLKHSSGDISNGKFIGDLHYTKNGEPLLIIGIHVLSGKETTLAKPFALLEKRKIDNGTEKNDDSSKSENCDSEYIVKAIVKKKLIFKGRPKPIVTDVPMCV